MLDSVMMNAVGTGQIKVPERRTSSLVSPLLSDTTLHTAFNTQTYLSSLGSTGRSCTVKNMSVAYNYKNNS